jgi:hypothetical protein
MSIVEKPFAEARRHIDDALLEELETLLRLEPPDQLFRETLLMEVADHQRVPAGGLESISRKDLEEAKKYWSDVQTCVSYLLDLLPHESFMKEDPQARRMRIELIGKARKEEQAIKARELFEQRAALEKWKNLAEAQIEALSKEPRRPNAKLGADRILVGQLAGIFQKTGRNPRDHFKGTSDKDEYSGDFFEFANAILKKVGSQRSDRARGKMINKQLNMLTAYGALPARRSPRKPSAR